MLEEKELKIFRELDDKLYLVNKNNTYKQLFRKMDKNKSLENVQGFINKLACWYFVKYSNKYIELALSNRYDKIDYMQENIMSFDKLVERLNTLVSREDTNADMYYKHLIIMAGWGLIYSKKTIPEYGYFRVQKMFDEFNSNFNLNLNTNVYDKVMTTNYSYDNPEIIRLLEERHEEVLKPKRFSKVRKLFRR